MHYASEKGHLCVIQHLLNNGAEINSDEGSYYLASSFFLQFTLLLEMEIFIL